VLIRARGNDNRDRLSAIGDHQSFARLDSIQVTAEAISQLSNAHTAHVSTLPWNLYTESLVRCEPHW